ncbi:MAG: class I mannose-6-phosphate isomerase [Planctomycetota bacterium]
MTTDFDSQVLGPGFRANYDKRPAVGVTGSSKDDVTVGDAIASKLAEALQGGKVLTIDCYVGMDVDAVAAQVLRRPELAGFEVIETAALFKPAAEIDAMLEPWLGGDDRVFGVLCPLPMEAFFSPERLAEARRVAQSTRDAGRRAVVLGVGATLVDPGDVLVYADLPRWEAQLRQRRDEVSNLGVDNASLKASLQYKRSYFIDWRVCDRHKKPLLARADFFLDTTDAAAPMKLAAGPAVRAGLAETTRRPFRVVPFFDPGPWGGQWMREVCGLEGYNTPEPPNYAWCFDCVPEENSLLLEIGGETIELPSVDALFLHPRELLGDPVHARFGDEFPIRFDFLDTMDGGNLSFQVHPLTEYIQQHFGMAYTQDESYYLLDASADGTCYLGLKPGVESDAFREALETAQAGGAPFDADAFANCFPAKKHDHFLIPAGTVHCSGRNTMVLEISATPYIFTFKLWDWGRLGLDGKPRPINIARGMDNIDWSRDTASCERELINAVEPVAEDDGWREERTGLHRREFIETRRHWFTQAVPHDTGGVERGGVQVLNLVEGRAALVESPSGAFAPFEVHFAETWIVPAAVGPYTVRPLPDADDPDATEHATLRASVRTGL